MQAAEPADATSGQTGPAHGPGVRRTRQLVRERGFRPVAPPKRNRRAPWQYDKELYKRRNEIKRLFRRLKDFRRIFSRFDKLDVMFLGFVTFGLIVEFLRLRQPVPG